jgi:hypothetical protein
VLTDMARPLFVLFVVILIGLAALRFVLGLASVAGWLFALFIKVALVAGLIYLGVSIVSPDTARKLREHFLGPETHV